MEADATLGLHRLVPRFKIKPTPGGAKPIIFCVRWSSDGKLLASAIDDGRIRIYDGATGRTRFSLMDEGPPPLEKQDCVATENSSHVPSYSLSSAKASSSSSLDATAAAKLALSTRGIDSATIAMRFSPSMPTNAADSTTQYTLLTSSSSGAIRHIKINPASPDAASQPLPECVHEIVLGGDSTAFCLDYNARGTCFAAGCKDSVVRIFDEETYQLKQTLDGGGGNEFGTGSGVVREMPSADFALKVINKSNAEQAAASLNKERREVTRHSNRIYSVRFACGFSSFEDNLLVSAGWDRTMQVWDLRAPGPPVKSYYGVYLAGDALDVVDCDILTASNRPTNQLQIWDMRFGGEPRDVAAYGNSQNHEFYSAQFSSNRDINSYFNVSAGSEPIERTCFIAAGGVGTSSLKILDHTREDGVACMIDDLPGGVVSLDFCPQVFVDPKLSQNGDKGTTDTTTPTSKFAHLKEMPSRKKQMQPGTRLAVACRDASIRVVEIFCIRSSQVMTIDDEEEVEDGDEGDHGPAVSVILSPNSRKVLVTSKLYPIEVDLEGVEVPSRQQEQEQEQEEAPSLGESPQEVGNVTSHSGSSAVVAIDSLRGQLVTQEGQEGEIPKLAHSQSAPG